jgi:hypothetical protein
MIIDMGILMETKFQAKHTTRCEEYDIVAMKAKSSSQHGVALFYQRSDLFHVEGTREFGPNVIRTTLASGRKSGELFVPMFQPVDHNTLSCIQAATSISSDLPLILLGDLNVDLRKQMDEYNDNDKKRETITLVASLGIEDLSRHFMQRKGWGDWTW